MQDLPQPTAITADSRDLEALAKALASTLGNDASSRQLLKAEALKKFDGDYDVLYGAFANAHPIFGQQVATSFATASAAGLTLNKLLARTPNLNISVPVHINDWDTNHLAPLVIFIPAGFSERTTKHVKAYDKDGNAHWLDAKKATDYPVVVVGPSERVSAAEAEATLTGQTMPGKITANKLAPTYIEPVDISGSGGSTSSGTSGTTSTTSTTGCRVDKQVEYLRSMHMEDVSEYESWFLGQPEIKLQIKGVGANGGNNLYSALFTMSRSDIENTWFCNSQLYYWDTTTMGDAVEYYWLEQDGGFLATISLSFEYKILGVSATASVNFQVGSDDDVIGYKTMNFNFCPSKGYYSLGHDATEFRWQLDSRP